MLSKYYSTERLMLVFNKKTKHNKDETIN